MRQKSVQCPFCLSTFTVGEQIGGKVVLGLIGAAFGKVDPLLGVAASLVGIYLGHVYIDNKLDVACPQCAQVLTIVNAFA